MKTITLAELIERLKTLPADSRVRLSEEEMSIVALISKREQGTASGTGMAPGLDPFRK